MGFLQYKTIDNADPQELANVFFCCHPQDHDLCFEDISAEIHKTHDCAIWYQAGSEEIDDLTDLTYMELFVIPVTSKFLNTPNVAMDVYFPIAKENNIPILPIIQEPGLEKLFNKKCGDLQLLDRYTDIIQKTLRQGHFDYEKKLKKMLDSILLYDETTQRILDAFDGSIFLSYRKDDWKHAVHLMRFIHQLDFCRDIAVWFDDFLIPGENYNGSIEDALLSSDLFILSVTPNLINGPNYVMTTEYPMALEEGIPILPVEFVPTDPDQLAQDYPGIPDCVEFRDQQALIHALWDAVKHLSPGRMAGDPEHDYLIGLAYLNGIGVEGNYEKGIRLITSAAEAGWEEAVEKLLDICRLGRGIRESYPVAVQLQKQKIKKMEHTAYITNLAYAYLDLGHIYDKMGHYAGQEDFAGYRDSLLKAAELFQRHLDICPFYKIEEELANCYLDISFSFRIDHMYPQAMDYARKALAIRKSLVARFRASEDICELAFCYGRCYDICQRTGNKKEAAALLQDRIELLESVPEKYLTRDLRLQLGFAYSDLAKSMPMRKFLIIPNRERIQLLDKTLSIFLQLYTQNPDDISAERGVIDIHELQMKYLYNKIKKLWKHSPVDDIQSTTKIIKKIQLE